MKNPTKSALIVIDMERGFIEPESAHCIRTAKATVPACSKAMAMAREKGIPVFLVNRIYRADGSDVESTRYHTWVEGGKAMIPGRTGALGSEMLDGMKPEPGDYTLIKPRFSAFFQTELDLILRRLRVETVILIGTTTPNCIRTTCYDGISLDYNVVILPECCSAQTEEIQRVNMEDMERIGAKLLTLDEFASYDSTNCPTLVADVCDLVEADTTYPE